MCVSPITDSPLKLLLLDSFGSFTRMLANYLRQMGAEVLLRHNDKPLAELASL